METVLYDIQVALSWDDYKLLQSRMLPQDHDLATRLAAAIDVAKAQGRQRVVTR